MYFTREIMDCHLLSAETTANIVFYFKWKIAFRDFETLKDSFRQAETGETLSLESTVREGGWAYLTWVFHGVILRYQSRYGYLKAEMGLDDLIPRWLIIMGLAISMNYWRETSVFLIQDSQQFHLSVLISWQ